LRKREYIPIIDGARTCPWEDSGGPWGYLEKIEILKNKKHRYFREIADWVGIDDFKELDLESFNQDDIIFRNPKTELVRYKKATK